MVMMMMMVMTMMVTIMVMMVRGFPCGDEKCHFFFRRII